MIKPVIVVVTLFTSSLGWACQLSSANIKGIIVGASYEKKMCKVKIEISESTPNKFCPLKLKKGAEIDVSVKLSKKNCPLDEGPVVGTVSTPGGPYIFRGTIDGHKI